MSDRQSSTGRQSQRRARASASPNEEPPPKRPRGWHPSRPVRAPSPLEGSGADDAVEPRRPPTAKRGRGRPRGTRSTQPSSRPAPTTARPRSPQEEEMQQSDDDVVEPRPRNRGPGRPPSGPSAADKAEAQAIRAQPEHKGVDAMWQKAWDQDIVKGRRFLKHTMVKPEDITRFTEAVDVDLLPEQVQAAWRTSDEKAAFENLGADHKLLSVWKVCLQLYGKSPLAFVSPANDLYYTPSNNSSTSVRWSQPFCDRLGDIVAHGAFRRSQPIVSYFIRFAVACRLDIRRAMRPLLNTTCSLLSRLEELTSVDDWDHDIHTLHVQLRNEAKRSDMQPSMESDLLYRLGKISSRQREVAETDHFPVSTIDLSNIVKALDEYTGNSHHTLFPRAELMYKAYLNARKGSTEPEMRQLKLVHTSSWLQELCQKYSPDDELADSMVTPRLSLDSDQGENTDGDDGVGPPPSWSRKAARDNPTRPMRRFVRGDAVPSHARMDLDNEPFGGVTASQARRPRQDALRAAQVPARSRPRSTRRLVSSDDEHPPGPGAASQRRRVAQRADSPFDAQLMHERSRQFVSDLLSRQAAKATPRTQQRDPSTGFSPSDGGFGGDLGVGSEDGELFDVGFQVNRRAPASRSARAAKRRSEIECSQEPESRPGHGASATPPPGQDPPTPVVIGGDGHHRPSSELGMENDVDADDESPRLGASETDGPSPANSEPSRIVLPANLLAPIDHLVPVPKHSHHRLN